MVFFHDTIEPGQSIQQIEIVFSGLSTRTCSLFAYLPASGMFCRKSRTLGSPAMSTHNRVYRGCLHCGHLTVFHGISGDLSAVQDTTGKDRLLSVVGPLKIFPLITFNGFCLGVKKNCCLCCALVFYMAIFIPGDYPLT